MRVTTREPNRQRFTPIYKCKIYLKKLVRNYNVSQKRIIFIVRNRHNASIPYLSALPLSFAVKDNPGSVGNSTCIGLFRDYQPRGFFYAPTSPSVTPKSREI